jgi:hypothetical protein
MFSRITRYTIKWKRFGPLYTIKWKSFVSAKYPTFLKTVTFFSKNRRNFMNTTQYCVEQYATIDLSPIAYEQFITKG